MANKRSFSAAQMIEAINKAQGRVYVAAELLSCNPATVYNYLKKFPTVAAACAKARGIELDSVELELMKQIKSGNIAGIIYYLKTKGRARGWNERLDINFDIGQVQTLIKALETLGKSPSEVFEEIIRRAAMVEQDANN